MMGTNFFFLFGFHYFKAFDCVCYGTKLHLFLLRNNGENKWKKEKRHFFFRGQRKSFCKQSTNYTFSRCTWNTTKEKIRSQVHYILFWEIFICVSAPSIFIIHLDILYKYNRMLLGSKAGYVTNNFFFWIFFYLTNEMWFCVYLAILLLLLSLLLGILSFLPLVLSSNQWCFLNCFYFLLFTIPLLVVFFFFFSQNIPNLFRFPLPKQSAEGIFTTINFIGLLWICTQKKPCWMMWRRRRKKIFA